MVGPEEAHIPQYPDVVELALAHRTTLAARLEALQPRISELTFAGLYLFRNAHRYRLSMIGDAIIVAGAGYDGGSRYILPPLAADPIPAAVRLVSEGWELYGADASLAASVAAAVDVEAGEDRDNADYLYLREELATLPGNRFHKKKNRLRYFEARHDYRVVPLDREAAGGCLELLERWGGLREGEGSASLLPELEAAREGLLLRDELGLEGVAVRVEGEVAAFALGERLNRDTSVCHFEKADPFMEGLYQLVNREFNARLFTDCRYVNREQDLGEPSLRRSKLSYHPVELVSKLRLKAIRR